MNIAIFTEAYLPYVNGVVTHIKWLKKGLEERGHNVMIVAANSLYDKTHEAKKKDSGVVYSPGIRLKKIYGYDIASPISLGRLRKLKEWKPDIIHIHNEFGIGMSGALIAKVLKIPFVYTLHTMYDDYMHYIVPEKMAKVAAKVSHPYAKALAVSAQTVIGPSEKVAEYFHRIGVKKRIIIMPNSVDTKAFNRGRFHSEEIAILRANLDVSLDDFLLCFCGRLGEEKNLDVLIENLSKNDNPRVKLLIVGGGPLEEHLRDKVKNLDKATEEKGFGNVSWEERIKFVGRTEHKDIPIFYAASDAFITCSLSEVYSISLLEAFSSGLPAVCALDPLNEGQVSDGVNGFYFNPDNAEQMNEKVNYLANLPKNELSKFRGNARRAANLNAADKLSEKIEAVYVSSIEDWLKEHQKFRK